ncbi:unnamed protein product [Mytilus coruscus]|uniref:Uncharacterized protein n=1 Tax=Mytilus coruscus TaxID=42192 RepID=A0A6J8BAU6_MYTCO|nr:unnamed protein product [Mytilus coruscus]
MSKAGNFPYRTEYSIHCLESLETSKSTFITILTLFIYNKLPSDVRTNITRDRRNDDWDIESLRAAIIREVCVQVAGQSTGANHKKMRHFTGRFVFYRNDKRNERKTLSVDDTFDNKNSVKDYCRRYMEKLTEDRFELPSWNSNIPKLQEIDCNEKTLGKDEITKILGMQRNAQTDKLFYQSNNLEKDE